MSEVGLLDLPELACDVLRTVRNEVLTGPEKWTQGMYARDEHGKGVSYTSSDAVCFCMAGAFQAVMTKKGFSAGIQSEVLYYFNRKVADRTGWSLISFNDYKATRVEDIHGLMDQMLAEAPCSKSQ